MCVAPKILGICGVPLLYWLHLLGHHPSVTNFLYSPDTALSTSSPLLLSPALSRHARNLLGGACQSLLSRFFGLTLTKGPHLFPFLFFDHGDSSYQHLGLYSNLVVTFPVAHGRLNLTVQRCTTPSDVSLTPLQVYHPCLWIARFKGTMKTMFHSLFF